MALTKVENQDNLMMDQVRLSSITDDTEMKEVDLQFSPHVLEQNISQLLPADLFNNELFWLRMNAHRISVKDFILVRQFVVEDASLVSIDTNKQRFKNLLITISRQCAQSDVIFRIMNDCCKSENEFVKQLINAPRINAILPPNNWDNNKFWALVYQQLPEKIENIIRVAHQVGFECEHENIFYPDLNDFLNKIHNSYISLSAVLPIIKECSRDDKKNQSYLNKINQYFGIIMILDPQDECYPEMNDSSHPVSQWTFLGKPLPRTSAAIALRVLSGFMMAIGTATAVVGIAFALMSLAAVSTVGIIAGVGLASTLSGMSLFSYTGQKKYPTLPEALVPSGP